MIARIVVKRHTLLIERDHNILHLLTFLMSVDVLKHCLAKKIVSSIRITALPLELHPKLFIVNCASEGRRIDIETISRSIPLWRSDNTCDMLDKNPKAITLAAI